MYDPGGGRIHTVGPATAIIAHYYPSRRDYIGRILATFASTPIQEIILWNNSPHRFDGIRTINSSFNTLMGRYAAVLLAHYPLIYMQDDDLLVSAATITRMLQEAAAKERRIVGAFGMELGRLSTTPYTSGHAQTGPCDIALGRARAFHRNALTPGFAVIMEHGIDPGRSDDILFSMAAFPLRSLAIASPEFENLDEHGEGLSHEAEHFAERDAMALRMIRHGTRE